MATLNKAFKRFTNEVGTDGAYRIQVAVEGYRKGAAATGIVRDVLGATIESAVPMLRGIAECLAETVKKGESEGPFFDFRRSARREAKQHGLIIKINLDTTNGNVSVKLARVEDVADGKAEGFSEADAKRASKSLERDAMTDEEKAEAEVEAKQGQVSDLLATMDGRAAVVSALLRSITGKAEAALWAARFADHAEQCAKTEEAAAAAAKKENAKEKAAKARKVAGKVA